MIMKKHTIFLDGLLGHESIIFKLICSVSERTKTRAYSYELTTSRQECNIYINDIKNKNIPDLVTDNVINVWVSDDKDTNENTISRPLIATRVLHTLDQLIENKSQSNTSVEDNANTVKENNPLPDEHTVEFNISEEEASELAIVHDEILENPANKEESENNIELTLVKNEKESPPSKVGLHHVLVVDDSPSVRKQLELELEYFDIAVDYADCASAAFSLLNKNSYDLALLDVVLPDRDGFQICKFIKAKNKETIAIMLTGKATQADKIKGSLAGCNDYLIKPVGRNTFQTAVKDFIPLKITKTAIEA